MARRILLGFSGALLCATLCGPVTAQVYRCGTTYQDRPCEGGQSSRQLSSSAAAPHAAGGTSVDEECGQRGAAAQKIMWAREAGQTAEAQLAAAASSYQRKLVASVYRKRGSASEVRAAIESECASEKQREAQAATLLEAAAKLRGQDAAANDADHAGASPADSGAATTLAADPDAGLRAAAAKQRRCSSLRARADGLRSEQRAGGSAARMDSLNQQRRDADDALRNEGC